MCKGSELTSLDRREMRKVDPDRVKKGEETEIEE